MPRKKLAELRRVSQPVSSFDDHSSDDGVDHLNLGAIVGDESVIDPLQLLRQRTICMRRSPG